MIHIYAVNIKDDIEDSILENFATIISAERKERVCKFRNYRDKQRGVLSEVLLRYALYKNYELKEEISFIYNGFGKPALEKQQNIFFNLSHSGDWVICAVGDISVGVDVEQIAKPDLGIAKRFYSAAEYSYLSGLDEELQMNEFFKIWTLKESYIKEAGRGLNIPLDSFSFNLDKGEIKVQDQKGFRKDLQFLAGRLDDRHCYAVCINSEDQNGIYKGIQIVDIQELLKFVRDHC